MGRYGDVRLEFCGRVFCECPVGILIREPWILDAWEDFVLFKAFGTLPKAGGLDDQPAWLVSAMFAFEREIARIQREMREKRDGEGFQYDQTRRG